MTHQTETINRAMELIGRPTDESFTVTVKEDEDEGYAEFTVKYADGTTALVVWVEYSGHGEYEFEVPGAGALVDVEPLYGDISIDLLDVLAAARE